MQLKSEIEGSLKILWEDFTNIIKLEEEILESLFFFWISWKWYNFSIDFYHVKVIIHETHRQKSPIHKFFCLSVFLWLYAHKLNESLFFISIFYAAITKLYFYILLRKIILSKLQSVFLDAILHMFQKITS